MSDNIVTWCINCVAAVYDNKVQTDCLFGRIERFRENGVAVEQVEIAGTKSFQVGRYCNYCRDRKSLRSGQSPDRLKALDEVIEHGQVRVDFVIYYGPEHDEDDLAETINSINAQTIKPNAVVIVAHSPLSGSVTTWCVDRIVRLVADVDKFSACREAYIGCTGSHITGCDAGATYPDDCLENLEEMVNVDLSSVPAMSWDGDSMWIMSRALFSSPEVYYSWEGYLELINSNGQEQASDDSDSSGGTGQEDESDGAPVAC